MQPNYTCANALVTCINHENLVRISPPPNLPQPVSPLCGKKNEKSTQTNAFTGSWPADNPASNYNKQRTKILTEADLSQFVTGSTHHDLQVQPVLTVSVLMSSL